ncbi:MAG: type II CRISPR-associated endonuclease Cas1 [Clostridia bacterium]|nr:type II CRISPR-associated endonuclease Cas1 [Clostridia bacterium]
MSFRVVVIKNRMKLDLKLNYMICRGEEEKRVYIPEISTLILESTAISLTTGLISELIKNNVKIIFCDEKHNPEGELVKLYGNYHSTKRIMEQIEWNKRTKALVWQKIIKRKIKMQIDFLDELGLWEQSQLLKSYSYNLLPNDTTNREGHSAKVYFNAVFGNSFARRTESFVNTALNYGYSILLSMINREIVKCGYLTQLGIWHKNEFNIFNLSCDLIEPFRILVDRIVYNLSTEDDYNRELKEIVNKKVTIDNKSHYLENAISIYCQSVFKALNTQNIEEVKFYEL